METLRTKNGNFFVKSENLFGFFDQSGKFLREANAQEWDWAENMMEVYLSEIIFDIDSLKKIVSERKENAFQALITFSGFSRKIIEKIMDYFKGSPEELKIFGLMPADWKISATSTGGCAYSHREWNYAWGILPDGQIVKVEEALMDLNSDQNANGSWPNSYGYSAEYLVKNASGAIFFIVNNGYHYVTDHCDHNEKDECNTWEIFKKPNLVPTLEERRNSVLQKVKNFFLDLRDIAEEKYESLFDVIVSTASIEQPENIIFGEMAEDWSGETVSTGGCAYSDRRWCNVWAVNSDESVKKINDILIDEKADQNANGFWSSSYGYYSKYLKKQAPSALFFVVNEGRERHADRQQSVYENEWLFLRPLSRKEIMIKKINSKNKPATLGDVLKNISIVEKINSYILNN